MPIQDGEIASPVLITGAGGFIGSHLAELCVERGLAVRAFVHYNALGRWSWLDDSPVRDRLEMVAGDIRDYDAVSRAMDGCATVLHLAALIGIPYSYVSPLAYVRTNIEGAYNVLEAARNLGQGNVVMASTSETYGTARRVPIDEAHPSHPQSPYAASKAASDSLALSYHASFGLGVKVARPFNTYGPRQSARAIIPAVITQILDGQRTLQLGNLSPTRDLTFATDTARGILAVAACDALTGQAANIGTGREISIRELVEKIAAMMDAEVEILADPQRVRPPDSEVERLCADAGRLHAATGWVPEVPLDEGLRRTIAWLDEHRSLYRARMYSV